MMFKNQNTNEEQDLKEYILPKKKKKTERVINISFQG